MLESAQWIWFPGNSHYGVLRTRLLRPPQGGRLKISCAGFDRYELYVDGSLQIDGALPGDLQNWIPVETADVAIRAGEDSEIRIEVLVYHSRLDHVHYRSQTRPGFCAELRFNGETVQTSADWEAVELSEWQADTERMNHLLDPLESVDLRASRWAWGDECSVDFSGIETWQAALVCDLPPLSESLAWEHLGAPPSRQYSRPVRSRQGHLAVEGTSSSLRALAQELTASEVTFSSDWMSASESRTLSVNSATANSLFVDFEDEIVGFPFLSVESDGPLIIEIGWSERLNDAGVPVLFSKGTAYMARFSIAAGTNCLRTFQWTGFRYLFVRVIFASGQPVEASLTVGGIRRICSPANTLPPIEGQGPLSRIRQLCRHTLERTLPEFPIDCPSREKAHYWTDGLFIGLSWEQCYADRRFMDWYLEAFRRVPLRENGLFSSVYPGQHKTLIDVCLMPVIGLSILWDLRGNCPADSIYYEKALRVLNWFSERVAKSGLVEVDAWDPEAEDLVFLDHPGLPWHQFEHPGLDRRNPNAILNLYYLLALQSILRMAQVFDPKQVDVFTERERNLREQIRDTFWDGSVLRDSPIAETPGGAGVSWLANALSVLAGVIEGDSAVAAMEQMVARYPHVCRCTPGTIYWFLQAMQVTGLDQLAEATLVRLFEPMLQAGAVATWETFHGDIEDSLCHPWLAAPVSFFLEERFKDLKSRCRPVLEQTV